MSLILEALRKLEREKASPEQKGFVVLGAPGAGGGGGRGLAVLAVIGAVAVGALGAAAWHRLGTDPAPPPPVPAPPAPALEVVRAPPPDAGAARGGAGSAAPGGAAVGFTPEPVPGAGASARAVEPRFRLQAITRRDGRPIAILNDRLVREGDSFDGVRVVRIGELEIELETAAGKKLVVGF